MLGKNHRGGESVITTPLPPNMVQRVVARSTSLRQYEKTTKTQSGNKKVNKRRRTDMKQTCANRQI